MSYLLLIDGYNVIGPVAPPGRGGTPRRRGDRGSEHTDRWLEAERNRLLRRLTDGLDETVRRRTCVVFDARNPPKDRPSRMIFAEMEVRFAVDYPEADDLIEELIAAHTAPKSLTVVSSDHRVQAAAKRRRAGCFDSDVWLDRLLDGEVVLVKHPKSRATRKGSKPRDSNQLASEQPKLSSEADTLSELKDLDAEDALRAWMEQYGEES